MTAAATTADASVWQAFERIARANPAAAVLRVPARADRQWAPAGMALAYGEVLAGVERLRHRYEPDANHV